MKKSCLSLALLGAGLSLAACDKDEAPEACHGSCTVIRGRLLTAGGTAPIARVPVEVKWYSSHSGFFGGETHLKAESTTKKDGWYELTFFIKEEELTEGYFTVNFQVDKKQYYDLGSNLSFPDLPRDTTIVQDYLIPRKGYLLPAITNPGQLTSPDYFSSNFTSDYGLFPGGAKAGPVVVWPTQAGTPVEVPADQPLAVQHVRLKNGVRTFSYDTLQVEAATQKTYTVTF